MKLLATTFFISLFATGVGYILKNSLAFGICVCTADMCNPVCLNLYDRIGVPMFYGFAALSLVFLILWIVPKAIPAWKKFAVWYIPLAVLLFIFYPTHQSMDLISPSLGPLTQWVSAIYVVVSVGIIFFAKRKLSKGK